jgi:hypothetical protein
MGQMINLPHVARRNGLTQARHDFVGLPEIKIKQLAHQPGVAVASGLELLQVHQRDGGAAV